MKFFRKVEIFFDVVRKVLLRAGSQVLSQAIAELSSQGRIELTDLLFFSIRSSGLTLMSFGAGGSEVIQSMKLSVEEAKQIFLSIKRACVGQDIVSVRIGELSWTTDARSKSNPDKIIIKFNGPLGCTRAVATREGVANAVAQFANRFGLK